MTSPKRTITVLSLLPAFVLLPASANADDARECSAEQLRSLASSSFLPEAIAVCTTLAPLARGGGLLGEDERFEAFAGFCEGRSGLDFSCSLTNAERQALLGDWRGILASAQRRKELVTALCGRVEQAAGARDVIPEGERARFDEGIASVRTACAGRGIPSEEALAVVQAASALGQQARRLSQTPPPAPTGARYLEELAGARQQLASALGDGSRGSHGAQDGERAGLPRAATGAIGGLDECESVPTSALSTLVPGGGVLDMAVSGLASVLASRARTELEAAAVDRLEHLMCRGDSKTWFVHTCAFFAGRSPELGVRLGTGLRTAMGRDVLAMPSRARLHAPSGGGGSGMRFRLFFELLDGLLESLQPADIGDRVIGTSADWRCTGDDAQVRECRRVREHILRAGLLVLSLSVHDVASDPLPEDTLFGIARTLVGHDLDDEDRRLLRRLSQQIRSLRRLATAAAEAQPEVPADGEGGGGSAQLRRIVPIARTAVAVVNLAVRTTAPAGEGEASDGPGLTLPDGLPEILDAMGRGELTDVMVSTTAAIASFGPTRSMPSGIVRAMAVGAELAQAESREQVEAAIEAVAAPAGAWRQKQSKFMLSVGGLVGIQGSAEWLSGAALPERPRGTSLGVLGAVGLDVSFPLRPGSLGVFLSVLDLGALMSVPISEVTRATVTQDGERREAELEVSTPVRFENVLSPGLYLRLGIPTLPLTLGAGASIVPRGRHIEEIRPGGGGVSEDVAVIRVMALLGVDVTLFPL